MDARRTRPLRPCPALARSPQAHPGQRPRASARSTPIPVRAARRRGDGVSKNPWQSANTPDMSHVAPMSTKNPKHHPPTSPSTQATQRTPPASEWAAPPPGQRRLLASVHKLYPRPMRPGQRAVPSAIDQAVQGRSERRVLHTQANEDTRIRGQYAQANEQSRAPSTKQSKDAASVAYFSTRASEDAGMRRSMALRTDGGQVIW
jgi:hypothetical protein